MNRRMFSIVLLCTGLAFPALGADLADGIVSQLRAQGFTSVDVSTTLLGRVRILAESGASRREIVLNPRTGEILRDYEEILSDGAALGGIIGRPAAAAPAVSAKRSAEFQGESPEKPEDHEQESHDSEDSSDHGDEGEDDGH